jgi:predicted GNAT family acetyltransferase
MAVNDLDPVSICHTSAATPNSAEAGVWTRPDHRGAGLAAAATVAWWELERRQREVIFYSTGRENFASQAVAAKLRLLPLGWLWTVR